MQVKEFLESQGYQVFTSEAAWLKAIEDCLGSSRFSRFKEQVQAVQSGLLPGRNLYDTLYKAKEFHLVLSRYLMRTVACYEAVLQILIKNQVNHLVDLGCGTGVFLEYLNQRDILGVGVDTSGNALMLAVERNPQNHYVLWDFQKASTSELEQINFATCIFGIDFQSLPQLQPEAINEFTPYLSEDSKYHKIRLDEAIEIWENWTPIFAHEGQMIQVLRLAWFDHFVAWIRAAEENDWFLTHLEWVETEERFPLMLWQYKRASNSLDTKVSNLKTFWGREI